MAVGSNQNAKAIRPPVTAELSLLASLFLPARVNVGVTLVRISPGVTAKKFPHRLAMVTVTATTSNNRASCRIDHDGTGHVVVSSSGQLVRRQEL